MLEKVHMAHTEIEATLKLARETIYWPGVTTQITQYIQGCETCLKFAVSQQQQPMQSHEIPQYSFQHASMGVFFADYKGRKCKFLVDVNHFSDLFELKLLPDMSAQTLTQTVKNLSADTGSP